MAHSLVKVYLHIVFATKCRADIIPYDHLAEVHSYIGGIINRQNCRSIIVGGTTNHVHILCSINHSTVLCDLMRHVKGSSSRWINTNPKFPQQGFSWQIGYAAFSVSHSNVEVVKRYIANQEAHHRVQDLTVELPEFFRLHDMEYDEDEIWL